MDVNPVFRTDESTDKAEMARSTERSFTLVLDECCSNKGVSRGG